MRIFLSSIYAMEWKHEWRGKKNIARDYPCAHVFFFRLWFSISIPYLLTVWVIFIGTLVGAFWVFCAIFRLSSYHRIGYTLEIWLLPHIHILSCASFKWIYPPDSFLCAFSGSPCAHNNENQHIETFHVWNDATVLCTCWSEPGDRR